MAGSSVVHKHEKLNLSKQAGMDKARVPEKDSSSETPHSPASSCRGTAEPADSGSEEHR
jgi:hypothetical protein